VGKKGHKIGDEMNKSIQARITVSVIGFSVWAFFAVARVAISQDVAPPDIGGLRPLLPVVPQVDSRPAQGDGPHEQFPIARPQTDNVPTASFLESLKGNDAAFFVTVGQGRILTTRQPIAQEEDVAVIAVGDPSIIDFEVLPNARMLRLIGRRPGITDLSITTVDDEVYSFEVHVGHDLSLWEAQFRQIFPDAQVRLRQLGDHVIVEGQARSPAQVARILRTLEAQLDQSTAGDHSTGGRTAGSAPREGGANVGGGPAASGSSGLPQGQIINLMRVPGVQQVMLQVRIAELDRTALREIGADLKAEIGDTTLGTQISNALVSPLGLFGLGPSTTAFGIFAGQDVQVFLRALRSNSVLNILAEPNLIALSGQQASFLAGGQFPVPIQQATGGASNSITVEFKNFGVQLDFIPTVEDDEVIRLKVEPEVSTIDFALGTTLVPGGDPVPGVNTRAVATTVELREGQTLAIAGLLQVTLDAQTDRIPGLGDLPVLGPMFSNTRHERTEKELLVLVTPYLVRPMDNCEGFPLPGEDIPDPTDLEFYFLNRIEGKTGRYFRSTTAWHHAQEVLGQILLESHHLSGETGFIE
jgi:pilus assembly protein CpaC